MVGRNEISNSIIDFTNIINKGDVFGRNILVVYLAGLVNNSFHSNGAIVLNHSIRAGLKRSLFSQITAEDVFTSYLESEVRPVFANVGTIGVLSSTLSFNSVREFTADSATLVIRNIVEGFWNNLHIDTIGTFSTTTINALRTEVGVVSNDWAGRFGFVEGLDFLSEQISGSDELSLTWYNGVRVAVPVVADTVVEYRELLRSGYDLVSSKYIKLIRGCLL